MHPKLFQHKKTQQTVNDRTIYYHEDDFRQVEIVPNDNISSLKAESEKIKAFSREHFDGYGFTSIYVRQDKDEGETKLNQRKITPNDFEKIINSLGFEKITNVLTGYGYHREEHKDCIAFVKDHCAIYYDFKDNIIEHIWFINHWNADRDVLAKFLHDLGNQWNLLLQDWNLEVTIDLKDKNSIDQYLETYDNE